MVIIASVCCFHSRKLLSVTLMEIACKRGLGAEHDCAVTGTSVNGFLGCDVPELPEIAGGSCTNGESINHDS